MSLRKTVAAPKLVAPGRLMVVRWIIGFLFDIHEGAWGGVSQALPPHLYLA